MSTAPAVTESFPWWFNTPLGGVAAALLAGCNIRGIVEIFVPPRPRCGGRLIAFVATVLTLVAAFVAWVDVLTDSSSVGYWISLGTAVGVSVGGLGMLGVRCLEGRTGGPQRAGLPASSSGSSTSWEHGSASSCCAWAVSSPTPSPIRRWRAGLPGGAATLLLRDQRRGAGGRLRLLAGRGGRRCPRPEHHSRTRLAADAEAALLAPRAAVPSRRGVGAGPVDRRRRRRAARERARVLTVHRRPAEDPIANAEVAADAAQATPHHGPGRRGGQSGPAVSDLFDAEAAAHASS